jgi:hypothetical protein
MPIAADQQVTHVKIGPSPETEYKNFPRMIYHVIEKPTVVTSQEELEKFLDRGWSTTPVKMNELAILDVKISEVEQMLSQLKAKRKEMIAQKKHDQETIEKCQP